MIERIERRLEPLQDRGGAGGRELLRDHDRGEPCEPVRALAQRRPAGGRQRLLEARVGPHQRGERSVEIGLGADTGMHEAGLIHGDNRAVTRSLTKQPYTATAKRLPCWEAPVRARRRNIRSEPYP